MEGCGWISSGSHDLMRYDCTGLCVFARVCARPRCVGDETSVESSLQGRCDRGGRDSGRKTCTRGLASVRWRVVVVEEGEGWWRIENTSHRNGRRHGPHLKLIQSGRDTQTEGQERFALALAEAMGAAWAGGVAQLIDFQHVSEGKRGEGSGHCHLFCLQWVSGECSKTRFGQIHLVIRISDSSLAFNADVDGFPKFRLFKTGTFLLLHRQEAHGCIALKLTPIKRLVSAFDHHRVQRTNRVYLLRILSCKNMNFAHQKTLL